VERDAPRGGQPAAGSAAVAAEIDRKTTTETPAAMTHWSTRTLAAELGTSPSMVQRVWKANNLAHYPRLRVDEIPEHEPRLGMARS
jgi:hypothetical protein